MKVTILDIEGKEKSKIDLPKCFSVKIREDIVQKVLEAKKNQQPYAPNLLAGKKQSDRGKIRHRRHVWQTHYGRGMSRVPRKVMSRRGTQFNWEASGIPNAKGGNRAHPPKTISRMNQLKINKKELKMAIESAISATANEKCVLKKYSSLKKIDKNIPFIVESKIVELKTKQMIETLQKILGENILKIVLKNKKVRSGKGKSRGRKYKKNAGLLLVLGEKQNLKTKSFDVVNVKKIGVNDLAKGGLGRITIYTEDAIKYLGKENEKTNN